MGSCSAFLSFLHIKRVASKLILLFAFGLYVKCYYPDEEKITYFYNLGGQLEKVHGYKSYGYDYVSKIGYDKFEQRTYLKYCNGAETFYTYDPQHRRLQNLTVNSGGNTIMDNAYTYDANSKYINKKNKHSHQKKLQPSHENLFVQPLQYLTVGQKTSLIEI